MVGGSVRDAVLGRPSKDIDLEVHGLEPERLEPALARVARVVAVGRSFGVYKVGHGAAAIDVALPRAAAPADRSGARGEIRGDPHLGLEGACRGRDLTLNAILADPLTGALADPMGGLSDLAAGRLRAVDPARFAEDPLRVFRVARFAATHELTPTPELVRICTEAALHTVAPERIGGELERLLTRARSPARGLRVLRDTQAWSTALPGLPPTTESDAPVDRAARLRPRVGPAPRDLALMLAALLHPAPSAAEAILTHLRIQKRAGLDVRRTVVETLAGLSSLAHPPDGDLDTALRRTAERTDVAVAVGAAESVYPQHVGPEAHDRATELGVLHAPLAPLVYGRDLLDAGIPRGPTLGVLLAEVRERQLRGDVSDPDSAVALAQRLWTDRGATRV